MWKHFVLNREKGSAASLGFRSYYGLHKPILIKTLYKDVVLVTIQYIYICIYVYIYRVNHKSVKHLKNSQQMYYATDHGNSYVGTERNC